MSFFNSLFSENLIFIFFVYVCCMHKPIYNLVTVNNVFTHKSTLCKIKNLYGYM